MTFDPAAELHETFKDHGIPARRIGRDLLLDGPDAVFSVDTSILQQQAEGTLVQLDVGVRSARLGAEQLTESFAGAGADESAAVRMAFDKFVRASLHVLLAALVDEKHGADQVQWEMWGRWRVCVGPMMMQGSPPEGLEFGRFLDELKAALLARLEDGPHWLRIYLRQRQDGQKLSAAEALLDNADWVPGRVLIETAKWPAGDFGARLFVMLMPAQALPVEAQRDK